MVWLFNIQSGQRVQWKSRETFKVRCTLRTSYRENNKPFIIFNKTSKKHILCNASYKRVCCLTDRELSIDNKEITRDYATLRIIGEQLSKEERRVDALALRAEERRDKLRKAAVRSKYPVTRRYLNGETRLSKPQSSIRQSITYGREPGELKHLSSRRKRKKHRFRE